MVYLPNLRSCCRRDVNFSLLCERDPATFSRLIIAPPAMHYRPNACLSICQPIRIWFAQSVCKRKVIYLAHDRVKGDDVPVDINHCLRSAGSLQRGNRLNFKILYLISFVVLVLITPVVLLCINMSYPGLDPATPGFTADI